MTINMDKEEVTRLGSHPVIYTVAYSPSRFFVSTPGSLNTAFFLGPVAGAIGGLASAATIDALSKASGKTVVEEYSLEDPSLKLRDSFAASLAAKFGLGNLRPVADALEGDDLEALEKQFGKALVLDFKTEHNVTGNNRQFKREGFV